MGDFYLNKKILEATENHFNSKDQYACHSGWVFDLHFCAHFLCLKPAVCFLVTDMGDKGDKGDIAEKDDTGNMGNMDIDQNLMLVIPTGAGGKSPKNCYYQD